MLDIVEIPARRGAATRVAAGQSLRVINTHGGQVADMWAFRVDDPTEYMSMSHSIVCLGRIKPAVGDVLVSNQRRPILTLVEDTSPGVHCMIFAACDVARYRLLGCDGYHDNCADNLRRAVEPMRIPLSHVPTPLNLFMNTKFYDHAVMAVEPPEAKIGDSVTFRAEHDCVVALTSCSQDLIPVNGLECTPKPIGYSVLP
jgi:uncharacterized protein YcgI (DUF1989 family)